MKAAETIIHLRVKCRIKHVNATLLLVVTMVGFTLMNANFNDEHLETVIGEEWVYPNWKKPKERIKL